MKNRIESAVETGKIPEETKMQHKGFSEWNLKVSKNDHQPIVQVCNSLNELIFAHYFLSLFFVWLLCPFRFFWRL